MEEEKGMGKRGLSRRAFLGLGGTALAGAAMAGMAGCAPQSKSDAKADAAAGGEGGIPVAESGASAGPDGAGKHSGE
ncbi:FAD-binding dehydrogenase, partial [Rubneribacter badeniensis]